MKTTINIQNEKIKAYVDVFNDLGISYTFLESDVAGHQQADIDIQCQSITDLHSFLIRIGITIGMDLIGNLHAQEDTDNHHMEQLNNQDNG